MSETSENYHHENESDENRWQLFVGDFRVLTEFLQVKSNFSPWILVKYFDALLRGIGQVVLSNNPISGLIVVICLGIAAPNRALAALIAGSIGLIWAVLTGHKAADNYAGLTVYNPVLIGVYTEVVYPDLFHTLNIRLWIIFVLGIMISVYLTSALNGLFSSCKAPCLTLPFIIVQYLIILSVPHVKSNDVIVPQTVTSDAPVIWYIVPENESHYDARTSLENETSQASIPATSAPSLYIDTNATTTTTIVSTPTTTITVVAPFQAPLNNTILTKFDRERDNVDWNQMFHGVIHSSSQLFALEHTPLACFIYLAIVIYSPIMGGCAVMGAFIGTLCGLLLVEAPYASVYAGVWGYNGLLTGTVVGGLVLIFTAQTFLATIFCIIFATLLQHALNILYHHNVMELKIYNLPFNIAAIVFVCISMMIPERFPRPDSVSFPEKQRYEYLRRGLHEELNADSEKFIVVKTIKYESGAHIV